MNGVTCRTILAAALMAWTASCQSSTPAFTDGSEDGDPADQVGDQGDDGAGADPAMESECSLDTDCDDGDPCTEDTCHFGVVGTCVNTLIDGDGDGFPPESCGGLDCDDSEDGAHPGAAETCTDGVDQDCDGTVDCRGYQACSTLGYCEIAWPTIPAGTFTMGSPVSEPYRDVEEVQHLVTLTHGFEIQATEVTVEQFAAIMGYVPECQVECGDGCPVNCTSWYQAAAYCNAISDLEGLAECYACDDSGGWLNCSPSTDYATPYDCPGYRLPTEAEWEYAARAGTTEGTYNGTTPHLWTNCERPHEILDPIAWFCGNSEGVAHPVGLKQPNDWGLYDVIGNVYEWCHDDHLPYSGDDVDPWGAGGFGNKVLRSSPADAGDNSARAASRLDMPPSWAGVIGWTNNAYGFRPARTVF